MILNMLSLCQIISLLSVVPPIAAVPAIPTQQTQAISPAGLAVVAGKGITVQTGNVAEANLGTVNPAETPSADFTFTLRNASSRPIVIDRIQPSCGCTTATATINGKLVAAGQEMPPLNPVSQAIIQVHINLTGQSAGSLFKFVAIYTKDVPQPAAMLQIHGNLTRNTASAAPAPVFVKPPNPAAPDNLPNTRAAFRAGLVPFAGLRVAPAAGVQTAAPNQGQHDFGIVSALDTPSIEQTFTLSNSTPAPLVLDRLQPSCHCTMATAEGTTVAGVLPTLAPGKTLAVHVTVSLTDLAPGPLLKTVLVYTKGNPQPAAVFTLTGELKPAVTLSPNLLDFEQVALGHPQTLSVTATLDARLTGSGSLPILASTNPNIRINPQPEVLSRLKSNLVKANPQPGKNSPASSTLIGSRRRTYLVTLLPTAAGPITGSLSFVSSGHDPKTTSALANASVLLLGQVTGDLSAQPPVLAFGTVRLGRGTARQVVLTGKDPADVTAPKITSGNSYVSAKLTAAPLFTSGQVQPASRILEVTLAANAPLGLLQTQVKVSLPNGQCLLVPVSAFVSPEIAIR